MKIFEHIWAWKEKVNFVDSNNCLVGYDISQCCCENANWFIADNLYENEEVIPKNIIDNKPKENDLENYNFNPNFFAKRDRLYYIETRYDNSEGKYSLTYDGGCVVFELINKYIADKKYLYLYNSQNGYYSHGFEFMQGNIKLQEGCI